MVDTNFTRLYEVLKRAHDIFLAETGDVVYEMVIKAINESHSDETKGITIFTFLINWNRPWYEQNPKGKSAFKNLGGHLRDLVEAVRRVNPLLKRLGERLIDIDINNPEIISIMTSCFNAFVNVCGPTGASKALHLLKPDLFVMWDDNIRNAYRVSTSSEDYIEFLRKTKRIAEQVVSEYAKDRGLPLNKALEEIERQLRVSLLKAIDEYNYLRFTKRISLPPIDIQHVKVEEVTSTKEKLQKIRTLIKEVVDGAMEVAEQQWAKSTGISGLIESSARKLWKVTNEYIDRNDLQGLLKYLERTLRDATGRKVAEYLRACGKKRLEDVYPQIKRIANDC